MHKFCAMHCISPDESRAGKQGRQHWWQANADDSAGTRRTPDISNRRINRQLHRMVFEMIRIFGIVAWRAYSLGTAAQA
jgi:hypothetical protein